MDRQREILSTNNWGILRILHGEIIEDLSRSIEFLGRGEDSNFLENNEKIKDKLSNLITISKLGDDLRLKDNMRSIYIFINTLINKGEAEKSVEYFRQSIKIIGPIYEGFLEREARASKNIVSGLTYGEKDLRDYKSKGKLNIEG